jgi:hypothetical protein
MAIENNEGMDLRKRPEKSKKITLHSKKVSNQSRETQSISVYEKDKNLMKRAQELLQPYGKKSMGISAVYNTFLEFGIKEVEKKLSGKRAEEFEIKLRAIIANND